MSLARKILLGILLLLVFPFLGAAQQPITKLDIVQAMYARSGIIDRLHTIPFKNINTLIIRSTSNMYYQIDEEFAVYFPRNTDLFQKNIQVYYQMQLLGTNNGVLQVRLSGGHIQDVSQQNSVLLDLVRVDSGWIVQQVQWED